MGAGGQEQGWERPGEGSRELEAESKGGKGREGVPGALSAGKMKLEFFENPSSTLLGHILACGLGVTQIPAFLDTNMLISPTQNLCVGGYCPTRGPMQVFSRRSGI